MYISHFSKPDDLKLLKIVIFVLFNFIIIIYCNNCVIFIFILSKTSETKTIPRTLLNLLIYDKATFEQISDSKSKDIQHCNTVPNDTTANYVLLMSSLLRIMRLWNMTV